MSKIWFSDLTIKNLPLPDKGQRTYWCSKLSGFGLRVSQGGSKTFVVLDPRAKVRSAKTIGRYGVIGLQEGRVAAKERLALSALTKSGLRPTKWADAADEYLLEIEQTRKPRTYLGYKRFLEKYGFTGLVSDVQPGDIDQKLSKLRKTPCERYHAFSILRSFLNWAYRKHYLDVHPMSRMRPPSPGKPRQRVLSDEELVRVWNACGEDRFSRLVKFLILSGQRKGECSAISHNMLGTDTLTFPPQIVKNNREHTIPLTPLMKELIGTGLSWGGFSKSKAELDARCGVIGWTLHDLRRTFRTGLGRLGVRPDIAERIVNHASSRASIVDVYDVWLYLPEMRAALEVWERHVLSLVGDTDRIPRDDLSTNPHLVAGRESFEDQRSGWKR